MPNLELTPDLIDAAGRVLARTAGREFACNPMMWRDVGSVALQIAAEPVGFVDSVAVELEKGADHGEA